MSQAQEAGRTYRLGVVPTVSRQSPAVLALLDELRRNGFVEGQNLTLVFGGFEVANEQLPEAAAALVKAAPDVIIAGPQFPLRALQAATRTFRSWA
jgi:putative ABC transport system substrate-binding protein